MGSELIKQDWAFRRWMRFQGSYLQWVQLRFLVHQMKIIFKSHDFWKLVDKGFGNSETEHDSRDEEQLSMKRIFKLSE
ncbi:unnamed protein product [Malus baccata var. baccata]